MRAVRVGEMPRLEFDFDLVAAAAREDFLYSFSASFPRVSQERVGDERLLGACWTFAVWARCFFLRADLDLGGGRILERLAMALLWASRTNVQSSLFWRHCLHGPGWLRRRREH